MFITIPLVLNILAILAYRGVYRVLAMLILPIIGVVFLLDHESDLQHGNLTGLFTILISGPLLVVLSLLGIANFVASRRSKRLDKTGVGVADTQIDNGQDRTARQRAVRWEIAGALLTVCGMILLSLVGRVFSQNAFSTMSNLLLDSPVKYAFWLLGAALGVVAGSCLAWFTDRKRRL